MADNYKFNNKDFSFKKDKASVLHIMARICKWAILIVLLVCLYYFIYSLIVSSNEERRLSEENQLYQEMYPKIQRQIDLNKNVIKSLQSKDNVIYEELFHTEAPDIQPSNISISSYDLDSLKEKELIKISNDKLTQLMSKSKKINSLINTILDSLIRKKDLAIPMFSPIRNMNYAEVAASIGPRYSPFVKVKLSHTGLDIIASPGEEIYAAAKGVVEAVEQSHKARGKQLVIRHKDGYKTIYSHLNEILVKKGQTVDNNTVIATVGMSGNSFAPHLHYEVWKDDELRNPINFMFASLSLEEYADALYMSINTQQSLD